MKQVWMLLGGLVAGVAMGAPGTYVGSGTVSIGGGEKTTYTAKIVVEDIVPKKVVKVTESYVMSDGKKEEHVLTFRFQQGGLLKVDKKGVNIGCGYCFDHLGENRWCDYRIQTDNGPLHVNMYYDAVNKSVYRIGDFITLKGVGIWNDSAKLQEG